MTIPGNTTFALGDYVQMGHYNGNPITWRVVGNDENGPLLISDKVLCMKSYDAAGAILTGSHARAAERTTAGSDFWYDSNIHSWLISRANAGNVTWLCGNTPSSTYVRDTNGVAYDTEKGFLNSDNFTDSEISAIKTVALKSIVNGTADISLSGISGSTAYVVPKSWSAFTTNYDTAYYVTNNETVFLPDVKQMKDIYDKSSVLGSDYVIGTNVNTSAKVFTWLRTPQANYAKGSGGIVVNSSVSDTNATYGNPVYNGNGGIRPMFYLNTDAVTIASGSGTQTMPFVLGETDYNIKNVEIADSKVTVSLNHGTEEGAKVIIGMYAFDGRLLKCESVDAEAGKTEYVFDAAGVENISCVKAFVFNSKDSIRPLCDSKKIKLSNNDASILIVFGQSNEAGHGT